MPVNFVKNIQMLKILSKWHRWYCLSSLVIVWQLI